MEGPHAPAELLLRQTKLAQKVPTATREQIHAALRQTPKARAAQARVWQDLRLKERFGVGKSTFLDYARVWRALDQDGLRDPWSCRSAGPPDGAIDRLRRTGEELLWTKLAEMLKEKALSAAELARLLEALAKERAAMARLIQQRRAQGSPGRSGRQGPEAEPSAAKGASDDVEELRRRVQLIYGWQMPADCGHEWAPAGQTRG